MMDKETLARYWMWNGASCGKLKERRDAFVDTQRRSMEDERLSGVRAEYGDDARGIFLERWSYGMRGERPGRIAVEREPLVNVVHTLAAAHPQKRIVALNPGSATQPGGNVHIGFEGTEESFCLCSNLYSTLATETSWRKFYMKHLAGIYHKTEYPELMDEWLYSGNVTIFKEIRDGVPYLLPENEWGKIDIITSAPPGALRDDLWTGYAGSSDIERTILYSVYVLQGRNIFEAAIHAGGEYGDKMPHILVLPAFGCDLVRKDPTNLVAEAYAELLKSYAEYFDMVVFAAGRRSAVFCDVFEKKGLTLQTLEDIQEPWQDELELDDGRKLGPKEEALCADSSEQEVEEAVLRQMAEYSNVVSAEPNNKFCDVTGSILTAGWNGEAWKGRNGSYTAGVFTDGKSFVEELIWLPLDGNRITQGYEMFYMHTIDVYEKPKGKADNEKAMRFVPMIPPKKVLKKRAFASKMTLGEISEDMWKFEHYVRYIAGWGLLLSPSNRYRGVLQYMTDWRGKEVVCVMVALRDNEERYAFSGRGDSY